MNEIETLRASLVCDADGILTWRVTRGSTARAGDEAGSIGGRGYRSVALSGKRYLVHRVVWALHHGAWPTGHIDHIDGNKLNNRLENLRDVSRSVNMQNLKRARCDNQSRSPVPGVGWSKWAHKFRARPVLNGKEVNLGFFESLDEAVAVVIEFRRTHFEGNTL